MTGSKVFRLLFSAAVASLLVGTAAGATQAKPASGAAELAPGKLKTPAAAVTPTEANGPTVYTEDLNGMTVDWTRGKLTVTGTGLGGDRGAGAYRRSLSSRAARADAYRRFAAAIALLRIDASTRLQDLAVSDEALRTRLNAFVKGAHVLETNYWPDGSAEVVLGADLRGAQGLVGLLKAEGPSEAPEATPSARPSASPSPEDDKVIVTAPVPIHDHYSALILDGRGSGAKAALLPAIRDAAGKPIDLAGEDAPLVVKYLKAGAELDPSAGLNPLSLRAPRTQGAQHADLVLDPAASATLKRALAGHKLAAGAPVIVML